MLLCVSVILFAIDSLFNGMLNPLFVLIAGALVGCYGTYERKPVVSKASLS
jgi:hypothetical protein